MKKVFYGWWIVLSGFFIGLYASSVTFYGITAFVAPIIKEFGWSYTQVSFGFSLRGLESGIFSPLIGFLADRFGSRILLLIGSILVGLALIILSLSHSLTMFYLCLLLLGFGGGGIMALVTLTAVAHWFRKKVGIAFGIVVSGLGASGLFVPIIVMLIDQYGWRTALIILGLGMWAIGIPLSLIVRDRPEPYGLLPDGEVAPKGLGPLEKVENAKATETDVPFRKVLKEKSFMYLGLVEFMRIAVVSGVCLHVMPYLGEMGMSRVTAGVVAAGIPLFSIIGRILFGWLGDRYDKRYTLASAYLGISLGMFVFCYVETEWLSLIFLLLFSTGYGGGMVLRGSVVRDYFGRTSFGKNAGVIAGVGSIGGVIGPTLAGFVFDSLGSYYPVWIAFGILIGFSGWLTLKIKKPEK